LQPAVVALMGAAAALLWVRPDIEETLQHVEWSVLLFFAALFVLTGGLAVSGVLSRVAALLAEPAQSNPLAASLALQWAAALGAGLGGNGTPIGATANVITVSLSKKTHTPITTPVWLRSGLPVMIATCAVASVLFALFFGWMSRP
jgi:Na+/H+ antiporter NhaD/arsenite permease-like protein